MQGVDADVTGDRQTFGLGLAHQFHASGAADTAQVHAGPGRTHQLKDGVQGNGFSCHRHATQAHAGSQRSAGGHALTQVQLLWAQPDGIAKGAGILQGTLQHLGIGKRHFGLAKTDATGFGQAGHFGQHFAFKLAGQRPQREHASQFEQFGAVMQHFHQTRHIQYRLGVGWADHTGDASGHGRSQFGGKHAAQAHRKIDQTGRHHAAPGVDGLVCSKAFGQRTDGKNFPFGNRNVGNRIKATDGVNHAASQDQDIHAETSFF